MDRIKHAGCYIDDKAAAERLGVSRSHLRKMRFLGEGPPYLKIGRSCRYDFEQLVDWERSRTIAPDDDISDEEWFSKHPARRYRVRPWKPHDGEPPLGEGPHISILDCVGGASLCGLSAAIILPDPKRSGRWTTYTSDWDNTESYGALRWAIQDILFRCYDIRVR